VISTTDFVRKKTSSFVRECLANWASSIQILLIQLAIIKCVEGAASANEKWPDVFKFFIVHPGLLQLLVVRFSFPSLVSILNLESATSCDRCISRFSTICYDHTEWDIGVSECATDRARGSY
jgi:hypothetical protein